MALVSSRRETLGYVPQRAQPLLLVATGSAGHSNDAASVHGGEGGDDVKYSWPLYPRIAHCYNGLYKGQQSREGELIPKSSAQLGLESATRLHEVGIASNRGAACHGEYVPGPCTHRPSHHESPLFQKLLG